MIKLSETDKRLLYELSKTPRAPATELADRLQLGRDQVQDRINKFSDQGLILTIAPIIPLNRLGIPHHVVHIKLKGASPKKEDKFLKYLISHKLVTWVAILEGRFNVAYALRCLNINDALNFQDTLLENFHDIIIDRVVSLYVSAEFLSRDYLLNRKTRKTFARKVPLTNRTLDQVDYKILEFLATNSRMSSSEISRQLIQTKTLSSFSREAVSYRIQNLEASGWIGGYTVILNPLHMEILYCKIQIRLEIVNENKIKEFLEFLRANPRVIVILRLLGQWDFEIDIELDNYKQAKIFIMEITKIFPSLIRDYELIIVNSIEKWSQLSTITLLGEQVKKFYNSKLS